MAFAQVERRGPSRVLVRALKLFKNVKIKHGIIIFKICSDKKLLLIAKDEHWSKVRGPLVAITLSIPTPLVFAYLP